MRLKEQSATVWEAFPEGFVDVAVLVTDLGGTEGIILLLSLTYWLVDRRNGATVASYAVAGVVFVILLKTVLGLPRPVPDDAMAVERVVPLEDDPHGFPSGHAFMAVVVYGGLVSVFDRVRDPLALLTAGTLVVAISLTRVVLRLHYLGDVIAGAFLGLAVLVGLKLVVGRTPERGFALGVAIAVPTLLVSGFEEVALVGFGTGIGGLAASLWIGFDAVPALRSRAEGAVLVGCGFAFVVVVMVLNGLLAGTDPLGRVAVVVFHAVLIAGILLVPFAVARLETGRRRLMGGADSGTR